MNSIAFASSLYSSILWVITGILLTLLVYRVYKGFFRKDRDRMSIFKVEKNVLVKITKLLFGLSMVAVVICTPFYSYIILSYKSVISPTLNHCLTAAIILLALTETLLAFSISQKLLEKKFKRVIFYIITFPLAILVLLFSLNVPLAFSYPDTDECYTIDLPVRGTWLASHAGAEVIVNYHSAIPAQKYAMDIVKVNDQGKFFSGSGSQLDEFYTVGENIYAPVNGTIVHLVDSLPNAEPGLNASNKENPAGNHVVIEFDKDRFIFLAHLMPYSIPVKVGDRVNSGDLVGLAGNSGNTTLPHLHMHIQDLQVVDNKNAVAYPYRFTKIRQKRWLSFEEKENAYLIRNDLFSD